MASNGQKGKTRVEIAKIARNNAKAKLEACETRLWAAQEAEEAARDKVVEKANKAIERAKALAKDAGLKLA